VKESIAVGRDGTSDVISFLNAGMPGVEFGPLGDGHHGPDEWVSIESLGQYRRALVDFVKAMPSIRASSGRAEERSPGVGRASTGPDSSLRIA
jgi:succinyl-diaminopimelate desuccinylase